MLRPGSEAELADMVRAADGPLSVRGGGTRHRPGPGVALTTGAIAGVTLYEPGALTLVARAGTPLEEVEATLAAEGQRLPFEPMDHRAILDAGATGGVPTIGGAVAMNVSGPRRVQAGACRDSLIGVRFVDGRGDVIKNGGRVMKNVTGYDLVKLMAGSRGRLGVLTEVAFKVLPAAAAEATLRLDGLESGPAVAAMASALTSPFDVTGAAHDPVRRATWIRIEGLEGSVAYRAGCLTERLASYGTATRLDGAESRATWAGIRDARAVAGEGDIWRVHVRPSRGAEVLARAGSEAGLLDWGGGLVWLRLAPGTDLRARLEGLGGHATRVTGPASGALPPEAPAVAALSEGLMRQFDPRGILNAPALTEGV